MKISIFPILVGVLLSCANSNAQKEKKENDVEVNVDVNIDEDDFDNESKPSNDKYESHREVIQKEFSVSPNALLRVYNIAGNVKVEGYAGNKVIVEVEKTIKAEDKADVDLGVKEAKLGFEVLGDSLTFYTAEPYDNRPNHQKNRGKNNNHDYSIHLNYTIKVPRSMSLHLSTVNDGSVEVNDVDGRIKANNVNGKITLQNVKAAHDVHTVNGNVLVKLTASPSENTKFYTLNGKMEVYVPNDFSAECEFKSFNGNFYTDLDQVTSLPAKTEKVVKNTEKGTTYKLNKIDAYRIGRGGSNFKVETFNGNAYLRKQI